MGMKAYKTINSSDRVLQQIQDNAKQTLDSLAALPFVRGELIEDVTVISATGTRVPHKLGRKLQGWVIVRRRGPAVPYDAQDSEPSPDKFLALRSVNDVSIDVWVY